MRHAAILILAATALTGCATVAPQTAARHDDHLEIGYAPGALAYEAIAHKDWAKAAAQLEAQRSDDPARLLNLAHVYRMTGRTAEANALYARVLAMGNDELFELADGRVASARQLAAKALGVNEAYASLK